MQDLGARGRGRCVPAPALGGGAKPNRSMLGTGSVKPKAHLFYGQRANEAPTLVLEYTEAKAFQLGPSFSFGVGSIV